MDRSTALTRRHALPLAAALLAWRAPAAGGTPHRERALPAFTGLRIGGALPVELVAKRLAIEASGSSVVRLDQLTTEVLSLQGGGSASVRVAGRANELELALGGSAQLQASKFAVRRVGVKLGGSSGARLWAADALDGAIGGSALLRYRGDPTVQVARGGSARLARLD